MKIKQYFKHFIVASALFALTMVPAYAVSIGDQLLEPESGWQRINIHPDNGFDLTSEITYGHSNPASFGGDLIWTREPNQTISFQFEGTRLRLTGYPGSDRSSDVAISIDGISEIVPGHNGPGRAQALIYEKTNLGNGSHNVVITSGTSGSYNLFLDAIDIDSIVDDPIILDVVPENTTIENSDFVNVDLKIDNITEIAAEDILIEYDNEKLDFINFEEIDGMKLVHSIVDEDNGTLRVILASQGESNIVNTEEILLTLKFKGIAEGEALVDITKGKVTDGIEMEKDLLEENCDQAIITILPPSDVNNSGEYTLLDLGIDARHFAKDPSIPELSEYNTDVVVNNAIDDADLLEIAREMMLNSNYNL